MLAKSDAIHGRVLWEVASQPDYGWTTADHDKAAIGSIKLPINIFLFETLTSMQPKYATKLVLSDS